MARLAARIGSCGWIAWIMNPPSFVPVLFFLWIAQELNFVPFRTAKPFCLALEVSIAAKVGFRVAPS